MTKCFLISELVDLGATAMVLESRITLYFTYLYIFDHYGWSGPFTHDSVESLIFGLP